MGRCSERSSLTDASVVKEVYVLDDKISALHALQTTTSLPSEKDRSSERVQTVERHKSSGRIPKVKLPHKIRDLTHLAVTRVLVDFGGTSAYPTPRAQRPVSEKGLFAFRYVSPLFTWWGSNARVLSSQSLGVVQVEDRHGSNTALINGASHNYAGIYRVTKESETLHHHTTQSLPLLAHISDNGALRASMEEAIASFLGADFCVSTSIGYGSNYLALPALLHGRDIAVVADSQSHNSIFTGCFLSPSANITKFKHNDMKHLAKILNEKIALFDRVIVIIEGLYSMEGDIPSLADLYRLKRIYDFDVYCDEAHSFLTLGKTGRGCVELWNECHPDDQVPGDLVDIRTATLSKSTGGIGGIIVGKAKFRNAVVQHCCKPEYREATSLLTATVVQTLWALGQPSLIRHNLHHLSRVASFCRSELHRAGVFVYGDHDAPILPIWAGGPGMSARLSFELRKAGLLATPVSTPAVPYWESRVRINLSADYRPCDVDQLVLAVIQAVKKCGIPTGVARSSPIPFDLSKQSSLPIDPTEATATLEKLIKLIDEVQSTSSLPNTVRHSAGILTAAQKSQSRYGVGSGSARWISGTYTSHLAVEDLVARETGSDASMTYSDSTIGLASTVASLMRPLSKCQKHTVLLPSTVSRFVQDGMKLANLGRSRDTKIRTYHSIGQVPDLIRADRKSTKTRAGTCYTLYVELTSGTATEKDLGETSSMSCSSSALPSLLHDLNVAATSISSQITVLLKLPSDLRDLSSLPKINTEVLSSLHVLSYGSFFEICGLPGGFLAGPKPLIDELRYTSRGYMYTTSSPPFVMDMLNVALTERGGSNRI